MRVFFELRYTVIIKLVRTFYLKNVPAEFQKYLKHISWVISGTSSPKLSCNPRHRSRNISCNHRHHLLQPSWRRIFSSSNNQKTRVDSDINSDCRASSFDGLYIWCRKWDTASFVRAHQRKYWNALTVGRGHDDDGCSCNHRAVPPSDHDRIETDTSISVLVVSLTTWEAHHSPRASHSGCHELAMSLVRQQWPQYWYQLLSWTRSALVQVMAWRLVGTKPLPEPMLSYCQLGP